MESSVSQNGKKLGVFPYVIGALSYIPGLGVLFGIVAIIWSLLTKRKGRKTLALVGTGGIGFTFLFYGGLIYLSEHTGFFDKAWKEISQMHLNQLVQSIEFYKVVHGTYPSSLEELRKANVNTNTRVIVYDPIFKDPAQPRYFYYERVGDDHYFLRSVGADGKPFTVDDIVPQVDAASANKLGLLVDPPGKR